MNKNDFSLTAPGKLILSINGVLSYLPDPLPPEMDLPANILRILTEAERNLARLEEEGSHFPLPHIVIRPLIRREAVLSSQIEGTRTTFEELLTYEAQQMSLPGILPDHQEVQNYVKALDYGLERLNSLPISLRFIREIHNVLLNGVRGQSKTLGAFRKEQNWIGRHGAKIQSARYVPPAVENMENCLDSLEAYIHETESNFPDLIRVAMIHYQFEAIHPFLDGNGRVGRLLILFLLIEWGLLSQPYLYLSLFLENNRTEYYDRMLAVSQKGAWVEWISFFLEGVKVQAEDARLKIRAIQTLRTTYFEKFSTDRNRVKLEMMVDYFISTPISTVAQAVEVVDAGSFTTIQRQIDKLAAYGVVEEITGNKRNRIYRANEILRVLEG